MALKGYWSPLWLNIRLRDWRDGSVVESGSFLRGPRSVSSIYSGSQLSYNSHFRGSDALFWSPQAPGTHRRTDIHQCKQDTHIHKIKTPFELEIKKNKVRENNPSGEQLKISFEILSKNFLHYELFDFVFCFWEQVSLSSPGWLGILLWKLGWPQLTASHLFLLNARTKGLRYQAKHCLWSWFHYVTQDKPELPM